MLTLVIGNKNYSSWSLRPWLLLRQFDLAFEEVRLPLDTPEVHRRVGDYSPTRRLPVLRSGAEVVWDSLAICEVANERWLADRGWPTDPLARAAARCAAAEMHSGFAALRSQLPMNCRRVDNGYRWDEHAQSDIDRVTAVWRDLRARFGAGSNFLCGDFGIVDAMFAPVCVRLRSYRAPVDQVSQDYIQAIYALPAMQSWLDDATAETEHLPDSDRGP